MYTSDWARICCSSSKGRCTSWRHEVHARDRRHAGGLPGRGVHPHDGGAPRSRALRFRGGVVDNDDIRQASAQAGGVSSAAIACFNAFRTKPFCYKWIRIVPRTYNNHTSKVRDSSLPISSLCIGMKVYYDESNVNQFCERGQGRAPRGERAVIILPPSKGRNLQLQCAVSAVDGLVFYRLHQGSIQIDVTDDFAKSIYRTVKDVSAILRGQERWHRSRQRPCSPPDRGAAATCSR
jgi:hypothetical protein